MAEGIVARGAFAALQVVAGVVLPYLFMDRILEKSLSAMSLPGLGYWLGIPAGCFVVLGVTSLVRSSLYALWGAALAGYAAFLVPAALLWLTTGANYRGGGANIGVALLALAMPLYLPAFMIAGFICAAGLARRAGRRPAG